MPITIYRGTDTSITITLPTDALLSVSGGTLFFTVKKPSDVLTDDITDTKAIIKIDHPLTTNDRDIPLAFTATQTRGLIPGEYVCGARVKDSAGALTEIELDDHRFVIKPDITRRS